MHIVLHEPEIPQNTGNVARTCSATGSVLHLIKPLGFSTDDRQLKRAGLDYWHSLDIRVHESFEVFLEKIGGQVRLWLFTTKAGKPYHTANFQDGDCLVFGKETAGLPGAIRDAYPDTCLRLPMLPDTRSLNLSNSVAVALFEALRQQGFKGMI
ncbi:MAG: tRNA (uridine(34)/cytosine(34)/5-carboxymethylaminomethyluridine(34)-2'-O)-methyltransferase TrmL [Oscillospiraceae bacterium]|nr:tRNA (uridine(34)/cytosine(34)/5-carboxymethylaminomethyluridine(34)-2'-O)-methyltransferase TrmL [Oscillospiraceae bacterium]